MRLQGRALQQMAGAYALGILSPRARRRFEQLLSQDIEIRRACQQWEQRLSEFTPDIPPVRPPDSAWASIEKRLEKKQPARVKSRLRWLVATALLVGIALAIVWTKVRP